MHFIARNVCSARHHKVAVGLKQKPLYESQLILVEIYYSHCTDL